MNSTGDVCDGERITQNRGSLITHEACRLTQNQGQSHKMDIIGDRSDNCMNAETARVSELLI